MRETRFRVWDNGEKQYLPEDVYCVLNRTEFGAFGQMTKDWKDYREGEYFYDVSQLLEQFTGLSDKNGKEIFEGDVYIVNIPYRTTQTHWGNNIPNGEYTEPMEPAIKTERHIVTYNDGMFTTNKVSDFVTPLAWDIRDYDEAAIRESIDVRGMIWDCPDDGDLQYLLDEYKLKNLGELIQYLSGIEIIGNIHDNPELLK